MNSRQRVTLALNHKEPDRVPFDLGAGQIGGIELASRGFHRELLPPEEINWAPAAVLMNGLRPRPAPDGSPSVGSQKVVAVVRTLDEYRQYPLRKM